jgi:thiamine pyrophosphate-dependent acetolactate synthase large subunit-like protein
VVQASSVSKGAGLPIRIVVCNNRQYRAMLVGHRHHYSPVQEAEMCLGVTIDDPDYADLGKPFGFPGQKVELPAELPGATRNALRDVESGKTAILNVVLSRSTTRARSPLAARLSVAQPNHHPNTPDNLRVVSSLSGRPVTF